MVITRSTFAGSGRAVGKWLGDNLSTWELYRNSIQGILDFAAIHHCRYLWWEVMSAASVATQLKLFVRGEYVHSKCSGTTNNKWTGYFGYLLFILLKSKW